MHDFFYLFFYFLFFREENKDVVNFQSGMLKQFPVRNVKESIWLVSSPGEMPH